MQLWIVFSFYSFGESNRLFIHCTKNKVFHEGFLQWMWPNPQEIEDLVTFTEKILNGKLHFCAVITVINKMKVNHCLTMILILPCFLLSSMFESVGNVTMHARIPSGSFVFSPKWKYLSSIGYDLNLSGELSLYIVLRLLLHFGFLTFFCIWNLRTRLFSYLLLAMPYLLMVSIFFPF